MRRPELGLEHNHNSKQQISNPLLLPYILLVVFHLNHKQQH